MPLKGMRRFLTKIQKYDAKKEVQKAIEHQSEDIIKTIRAQLASGIDGKGDKVYLMRDGRASFVYAPQTIIKKRKSGGSLAGVTERITNFQSGVFYKSLYLKTYNDGNFDILSKDRKYETIIKPRSGPDLLTLSPQAKRFLAFQKVAPEIRAGINAIFYDII